MNTLQKIKKEYEAIIKNNTSILKILEGVEQVLKDYKGNKTKNLGDKGIQSLNEMLGGNIKGYFNNYKSFTLRIIIEKYKSEAVVSFYDCISNIEDIENELKKTIDYKIKNLSKLIEEKKGINKAVKLRDSIQKQVKEFKEFNYTIQSEVLKDCYNSDFKLK